MRTSMASSKKCGSRDSRYNISPHAELTCDPIRHRKREYILTMDQSDAGSAGIFSQWTNQRAVFSSLLASSLLASCELLVPQVGK